MLIVISLYHFVAAAPISAELAVLLVVVCTLLAVLIGFFVAAASGYMAGLVGSSSSPISGIGIISVIVISLVLVTIGKSSGLFETADGQKFLTALTLFTASIVLTTATISNDNLQDLKTGLLVEATPWRQQGCIDYRLFRGCISDCTSIRNFYTTLMVSLAHYHAQIWILHKHFLHHKQLL